MTALERIELLTGTHHTMDDWHRALWKKADTPAELTDLDVAIIAHFGGPRDEAAALAARTAALTPPAPAPARPAPAPPITRKEIRVAFENYHTGLKGALNALKQKYGQEIADLQSRLQQTEG